jgi:hypothetical protein
MESQTGARSSPLGLNEQGYKTNAARSGLDNSDYDAISAERRDMDAARIDPQEWK